MKIINKYKILRTPNKEIYHLYNPINKKNIMIGTEEVSWINRLSAYNNFKISDVYNIVGEEYYLQFLTALEQLGLLVNEEKIKKDFNIFKIMFSFNISITEIIHSKKISNLFEKILFRGTTFIAFFTILSVLLNRNILFNKLVNINLSFNTIICWIIVVFISGSLHEFSHAIISKNRNVSIPDCGLMLLIFNPSFFVDLSGIAFVSRMVDFFKIMISGIIMNFLLLLIGLLMYIYTPFVIFSEILILVNLLMILINTIPFFEYDGGIIFQKILENQRTVKYYKIIKYIQNIIVYSIILFTFYSIEVYMNISGIISVFIPVILSGILTYFFSKKGGKNDIS